VVLLAYLAMPYHLPAALASLSLARSLPGQWDRHTMFFAFILFISMEQ
jgi:hypothetical protein